MKTFTDSSCAAVKFMGYMLGVDDIEHSSALVCVASVPVAGVIFTRDKLGSATIGIWVGDASRVPRTWGHAVFNYAFNVLGLERLTSIARADNVASINMTEKVGFRLVDKSPDGTTHSYEMAKEDCWMLKSNKWGRVA